MKSEGYDDYFFRKCDLLGDDEEGLSYFCLKSVDNERLQLIEQDKQ